MERPTRTSISNISLLWMTSSSRWPWRGRKHQAQKKGNQPRGERCSMMKGMVRGVEVEFTTYGNSIVSTFIVKYCSKFGISSCCILGQSSRQLQPTSDMLLFHSLLHPSEWMVEPWALNPPSMWLVDTWGTLSYADTHWVTLWHQHPVYPYPCGSCHYLTTDSITLSIAHQYLGKECLVIVYLQHWIKQSQSL